MNYWSKYRMCVCITYLKYLPKLIRITNTMNMFSHMLDFFVCCIYSWIGNSSKFKIFKTNRKQKTNKEKYKYLRSSAQTAQPAHLLPFPSPLGPAFPSVHWQEDPTGQLYHSCASTDLWSRVVSQSSHRSSPTCAQADDRRVPQRGGLYLDTSAWHRFIRTVLFLP
jgi:hypothetical protein